MLLFIIPKQWEYFNVYRLLKERQQEHIQIFLVTVSDWTKKKNNVDVMCKLSYNFYINPCIENNFKVRLTHKMLSEALSSVPQQTCKTVKEVVNEFTSGQLVLK